MSKLRVIKERASLVGNHEQDLRELGGTTLLSNVGVEARLVLPNQASNQHQVAEHTVRHKSMKVTNEGNDLIVTCHESTNHKVNCVHLFNLSLILIHKKIVSSATLTETNLLHQELHKATNSKHVDTKHVSQANGLHVSGLASHILNQSGYEVSANLNGHHLSEEHVTMLVKAIAGTQSHRKVRSA